MAKRLWMSSLLAALLIAAAGSAGLAIPSLLGPTGIVSVPTAEVAPVGVLEIALTYQSQELSSSGMYGGDVDVDYWALNLLAGVSDRAELWGAYALAEQDSPTISDDADMFAIGGKYLLAKEPEDAASLAIGLDYYIWSDVATLGAATMYGGGPAVDDVDFLRAYLVVTKDFTPMSEELWEWNNGTTRILGSVGLLYLDVSPDTGSGDSLTEPFIGLQFVGAEGTSLGLEYRFEDDTIDQDDVFSAVLRHRFAESWEVEVGTTNAGPGGIGLDDQDFFIRFGYALPIGGA
jgi:hypothetical protein